MPKKKVKKKKSRKSQTRKRQLRSLVHHVVATISGLIIIVAILTVALAILSHYKPSDSIFVPLIGQQITQQVNSPKYISVVRFSGEVIGNEETKHHNEMLWAGVAEDDISPPEVTNWGTKLRDALSDTNCIFVIAVINSGGGSIEASMSVAHTFKTLQVLCDKPVFAYSNRGLFSGAYMVAVTCPIIGMSPAAMTGSIGVFWLYEDDTRYWRKKGITFDIIKSGEHKISMSPINTLTPEQRKVIQDLVDSAHEDFLTLIIDNREIQFGEVLKGDVRDTLRVICDGRPYSAQIALKNGFVDFVGYYDDFLQVLYKLHDLDDCTLLKDDSTFFNIHGEEVKNEDQNR